MSLFQCGFCGCCENTALAAQQSTYMARLFDWTGIEDRKEMLLCSACGPTRYKGGTPTEFGKWHGQFSRVFLPKGKFRTNKVGNLEHIESGITDFNSFALPEEDK